MPLQSAMAAVFTGPQRPLEIKTYPVEAPGEGDALLSLRSSGICGTDVHIWEGRLPIGCTCIPGHEFIGRVEALGAGVTRDGCGAPLAAGDEAVACVAIPCGRCASCRRGESASCLAFGVTYTRNPETAPHLFGGYAQALFSPSANLVKLPSGLPAQTAGAFPCAGPTVLRALAYAGGLHPGALVVVFGSGSMGLFAAALAAGHGCQVILVASRSQPERWELCHRTGAIDVLDYRQGDLETRKAAVMEYARQINHADGADLVMECSGNPAAFLEGLAVTRTRGRFVVPGQYSIGAPVSVSPEQITFRALQITGSGQYTLEDLRAYLLLMRASTPLQELADACVTHTYAVQDANQAMRDACAGVCVKGVFTR